MLLHILFFLLLFWKTNLCSYIATNTSSQECFALQNVLFVPTEKYVYNYETEAAGELFC